VDILGDGDVIASTYAFTDEGDQDDDAPTPEESAAFDAALANATIEVVSGFNPDLPVWTAEHHAQAEAERSRSCLAAQMAPRQVSCRQEPITNPHVRRNHMRTILTTILLVLVAASTANAGVICQQVGNTTYCSGDGGSTTCMRVGNSVYCN
jgi:hypothetical protein